MDEQRKQPMAGPDKAAQRRAVLAARRAASAFEREVWSAAICLRLMSLPVLWRADTILSYLAQDDEPDLAPFHRWALAEGKTLAFPVTGPGGQMEAWAPQTPDALQAGRYGIREPVLSRSRLLPPETLDAVLVPCVAFDAAGGRLGRGGGYYDRYLPRCVRAERVLTAFDLQRLPRAAREEHDEAVDMAVTEKGIYVFAARRDI